MDKRTYDIVSTTAGWLTRHEGEFLEKAVRELVPKTGAIVEIGSYCGKSTMWLAQGRETVYAIDPHKGDVSGGKTRPTLPEFLENLRRAGLAEYVKPIVHTSKKAAEEWKKPVKFLFIDGLHDEAHALEDFSLWNPFVVEGGIVAMHDAFCGWDGAGNVAMRHIVYSEEYKEVGVVGSIIFGIKGKASVINRIQKIYNQIIIELCSSIYKSNFISKRVQFILVHRFFRIFLLNRFSSLSPAGKNSVR